MSGQLVVRICCGGCREWGIITDPDLAERIARGYRPKFRHRSGCGACLPPREMTIGWDSGVNPYTAGEVRQEG